MGKKYINILMIDDNPGDIKLVSEMLKDSTTQLFLLGSAGGVEEGLKKINESKFDLILLDLNLPDSHYMSGLEKIIEQDPSIAVIVLTSLNDETIATKVLQKHAEDYLVKGEINTDLLVRSIRYAIERKKKEEELRKLNRTLHAMSDSSQAMALARNEAAYLDEVCRIIVTDCGHLMVWVGYAEENKGKSVRPMAYSGFEEGYLETLQITWADTERGRGPTGTAIRTGKVSICRNMLTDPAMLPWRDEALKRGYASSIALPLVTNDNILGALTIYSKNPDPFSEDEVRLLSELTGDLAWGITAIRSRITQAKAENILRRDKEAFEKLVNERTQELLDAQFELEKSRRLSDIGTLSATVAHELRNPLAAINMAAYNIRKKTQDHALDSHLKNIEKKVAESNQIITNLLFYSRIKEPHYEHVNIVDIINECIDSTMTQYCHKKIVVERKFETVKNTLFKLDPLQMKELFHNILNNACDAIADKTGRMEIEAILEKSFLKITFKDNGSGMPKEILAKVFEPFFSTKAKGTGIGLAVCQQIVHMHEGRITIESEPGSGTTVSIFLPNKK